MYRGNLKTRHTAKDMNRQYAAVQSRGYEGGQAGDIQPMHRATAQIVDTPQHDFKTSTLTIVGTAIGNDNLQVTTIIGVNPKRRYLSLQNNSENATLLISIGRGISAAGTYVIPAGTVLTFDKIVPANEISGHVIYDVTAPVLDRHVELTIIEGSIA